MSFLPPKAPKPRPPREMVGFRPLDEQAEYIEELKGRGYSVTKFMNDTVRFFMDVDEGLSGVKARVEAFAVESGIAKPADKRDPGDIRWVGLAVAKLAILGLDAYDASRKSGAKK